MTELAERSQIILCRLATHVLDVLGCAAVTPSKAAWSTFELEAPYRFGWTPPMPLVEDEPLLVLISFCPELMAETTLWLDDSQLDTYLTVIEGFLDAMVSSPDEPAGDVYNRVQDELYERSPGALELISQIELRALDEDIVPPAQSASL